MFVCQDCVCSKWEPACSMGNQHYFFKHCTRKGKSRDTRQTDWHVGQLVTMTARQIAEQTNSQPERHRARQIAEQTDRQTNG